MARPSKLNDAQLREIEQRMLSGEAGCALAREFGVTYNAIKKRLSARVNQTKQVANQLIAAEDALSALPPGAQLNAVNLAAQLRAVSGHLASAATFGAMTAHRLGRLAHQQATRVDGKDPLGDASQQALAGVVMLTKTANMSAEIGLNLMRANKEATSLDDDAPPLPRTISVNTVDAA